MPFIERVRRVFTRSPPPSPTSSTPAAKAKRAKKTKSLTYKPGEMPPPKYSAPYDPRHQARLRRFSFSDAWSRRQSETKEVSPMASCAPSRRGSVVEAMRRLGAGRKSPVDEGDEDGELDSVSGLPVPRRAEASPASTQPELTRDELSRATQSTVPAN
ncbi:MAG: hypothetical protein M1829_001774 [Trizodia sp. TS-e1964]|nr:MAG: hypothetical protein M1829_001774 [Trizodia sp. TS-e1964]